ncbi:hypothetical protein CC2G_013398 [Coprinopsis cinerea AmutBmut pab1-1]|nr:hypothetical protein CC2G_013398 [Coprinopsis cinerea AmutBmut pab1-1]
MQVVISPTTPAFANLDNTVVLDLSSVFPRSIPFHGTSETPHDDRLDIVVDGTINRLVFSPFPASVRPLQNDAPVVSTIDPRVLTASSKNYGTQLPGEVWAEVFRCVVNWRYRKERYSVKLEADSLLAISHTCRFWRNTATNFPSLWGQVIRAEANSAQWMKVLISRAKKAPISIVSDTVEIRSHCLSRSRELQANWNALFHLFPQVVNFCVRVGTAVHWDSLDFDFAVNNPAPILHTFVLTQEADQFGRRMDVNTVFAGRAPRLRSLQLRGGWPLLFMQDPSAPIRHLTQLVVHHFSEALHEDQQADFTAGRWLHHLQPLTNLRVLVLAGAIFEDRDDWAEVMGSQVVFPRLEFLRLAGYATPTFHLLSALRYPQDCRIQIFGFSDTDLSIDVLDRILESALPSLSNQRIRADHWSFDTEQRFSISARDSTAAQCTFHMEIGWAGEVDLGEQLRKAFLAFARQLCESQTASCGVARRLSLRFGQTTSIKDAKEVISHFAEVRDLSLYSLSQANLHAISGHYHSVSHRNGTTIKYLLPNLDRILLDEAMLRPRTDNNRSYMPTRRLANHLHIRSSHRCPVSPVRQIVILSVDTRPRPYDGYLFHDFDLIPAPMSYEVDVVPHLSSLEPQPDVLAMMHEDFEVYELVDDPMFQLDTMFHAGADLVHWRFDEHDYRVVEDDEDDGDVDRAGQGGDNDSS